MKKSSLYITAITFFFIIISGCSNSASNEKSYDHDELKLAEINFQDIVANIFNDGGERIEWYGEPLTNSESKYLKITRRDQCGWKDCGEKYFLSNSHESKEIKVTVIAPFSTPDGDFKIGSIYRIPANSEIYIGCSKLCLQDGELIFSREIVGSELMN